jgi:diacylglycerol O-acyltransferase
VRHIALPQPGDWWQLMIQVARIHSRPLDRSRPLWEAYVIEGLDRIPGLAPGAFAVFTKFHHASVDGMAGVRIFRDLHASTPGGRTLRCTARPASTPASAGAKAALDASVLGHGIERVISLSKLSATTAGKLLGIVAAEATTTAARREARHSTSPCRPSSRAAATWRWRWVSRR